LRYRPAGFPLTDKVDKIFNLGKPLGGQLLQLGHRLIDILCMHDSDSV
jgi:hypothetical protein